MSSNVYAVVCIVGAHEDAVYSLDSVWESETGASEWADELRRAAAKLDAEDRMARPGLPYWEYAKEFTTEVWDAPFRLASK